MGIHTDGYHLHMTALQRSAQFSLSARGDLNVPGGAGVGGGAHGLLVIAAEMFLIGGMGCFGIHGGLEAPNDRSRKESACLRLRAHLSRGAVAGDRRRGGEDGRRVSRIRV